MRFALRWCLARLALSRRGVRLASSGREILARAPDRSSLAARVRQEDPGFFGRLWPWIYESFREDFAYIVFATVAAIVRAMGAQIESGSHGLKFSFGRATKVLEPGFHPLIPFVQRVRRIPTRSRTLDLGSQRVATTEGLVYQVDVSLVYRVVDVRKALIEIDDLTKGMTQMLGLGVQEVLRGQSRRALQDLAARDEDLAENLGARLAPWGVIVERAAFTSITPSAKTLRLTQLGHVVGERERMFDVLREARMPVGHSLALLGTRARAMSRTRRLRALEARRRAGLRLRCRLLRAGYRDVDIHRAEVRLRGRADASGRIRIEKQRANQKSARRMSSDED